MGVSKIVQISVTPTITAGAYSANDAVGGLLTFANAVNPDSQSGRIKSIMVIDKAGQSAAIDFFIFDATFTATADNAAFPTTNPTEAFIGTNCIAVLGVAAANYKAYNGGSVVLAELDIPFFLSSGTTLYGQAVTRGTPTYAATSDLIFRLTIAKD